MENAFLHELELSTGSKIRNTCTIFPLELGRVSREVHA